MKKVKEPEPVKEPTIEAKVTALSTEVRTINLKTQDDVTKAGELLTRVRNTKRLAEELKEAEFRPHKRKVDEVMAKFKPVLDQCKKSEDDLSSAIIQANRRLAAQAESERAKILTAFDNGTIKRQDTVDRKIMAIETPVTHINSASGSVTTRKVRKWKIIDATLIPREYLVPDDRLIRQRAIVEEVNIPGIEVYEDEALTIKAL